MNEQNAIKLDRMRYTKNTTSSRLAILAILFDVLFFVSIYKSDAGTFYYRILIGASILYNLVFMLATFLASEGVKNYKAGYSVLLFALGAIQIARIFILPMQAHTTLFKQDGVEQIVMGNAQFTRVIIYLVASSACCVLSAIVNLVKSRALARHTASLQGQRA